MPQLDDAIRFDENGLIPVAIQETASYSLLMIGFMNREALETTRETGYVHFWSRSRNRLWKKGESSGHVQRVVEIRLNCDRNSLLIEVEQTGAVCHDGYDTCYYRRLEPDNSLTIVRDRQFDPRDVYPGDGSGMANLTRLWWRAYELLRDHNLSGVSSTSRRLGADVDEHPTRLAGELRELAGVLDGSHRHSTPEADILLEASQVLYWIACAAVYQGFTWDDVRPDLALGKSAPTEAKVSTLALLAKGRADALDASDVSPGAPLLHDTVALVGAVMAANEIQPEDVIRADLDDLRAKPYLAALLPD